MHGIAGEMILVGVEGVKIARKLQECSDQVVRAEKIGAWVFAEEATVYQDASVLQWETQGPPKAAAAFGQEDVPVFVYLAGCEGDLCVFLGGEGPRLSLESLYRNQEGQGWQ